MDNKVIISNNPTSKFERVKITREQQYKMQEWLNLQSKKIAKESNVQRKNELNLRYVGVLLFIEEQGGEVVYSAKHSHKLRFNSVPKYINLGALTGQQLMGIISFLKTGGVFIEINTGGNDNEKNN